MDKKARNASKSTLAEEPLPTGGGVGNGVCHGLSPLPHSLCTEPSPEPGDGTDSQAQHQRPSVTVETCRAQGVLWEETAREGLASKAYLDDFPETERSKQADALKGPLPNGVPEGGVQAGDRSPVSGGDLEPKSLSEPPICERLPSGEVDGGSVEGDGKEHKELSEEESEKEGEEEEEEEEEEGGREARVNGLSGPQRAGKRQKGRERERPGLGESSSSKAAASSGGRHKQARRRNNGHHHHHHSQQGRSRGPSGWGGLPLSRELLWDWVWPRGEACLRILVDLIVLFAHRCGEGVEVAGTLLYICGSQLLCKATDIGTLRREAGLWGSVLAERGRWTVGALRDMGRGLASGGRRVLGTLLTLLCLALLCATGGLRWAGGALERLCGGRLGRGWEALWQSRAWAILVGGWAKFRTALRWGTLSSSPSSSFSSHSAPDSPGGTGRCQPGEELERLLALAQLPEEELDPFKVLGVETSATDGELKRAYRQLAVLVHPDKNKHPGAGEAFKVLRAAWDIVSNPDLRREYDLKRMAETELSKSMNEFLSKLQDDLKEAMNTMMCSKCEGKHKRFEMEREPSQARFCAECNKRHSAEEGDFWAESSLLGLRITYFALMDGKVYDITEWAGCQRIGISPDTHRVPYHISFGSKTNSSTGRHRSVPASVPHPYSNIGSI
ncbi:DJC14 protein, partial [Amia calva]|nr:DJC14 protein [Amia calva]